MTVANESTVDAAVGARPVRRGIRKRRRSRPHRELALLFGALAVVTAGVWWGVGRRTPGASATAGVSPATAPVQRSSAQPLPVPSAAGSATTGATADLTRRVAIPVTLLRADGEPARSVALHVVPANPRAAGWSNWDDTALTLTDEHGRARVELLGSGLYRVVATSRDHVAWSPVIDPTDPAAMTLRLAPAVCVTGTVTSADGTPLPGARLRVEFRGPGGVATEVGAEAFSRGGFTLPPVERERHSARHRIRVTASGHEPLEREFSAAELGEHGLHLVLQRRFR